MYRRSDPPIPVNPFRAIKMKERKTNNAANTLERLLISMSRIPTLVFGVLVFITLLVFCQCRQQSQPHNTRSNYRVCSWLLPMAERHPFHQDPLLHLMYHLKSRQNVYLQRLHRFHTCPAQCLVNRYRSNCRQSFARTSSALFFQVHQNVPMLPISAQAANWKLKYAVHFHVFLKCQQACRFESTTIHHSPKFSMQQ